MTQNIHSSHEVGDTRTGYLNRHNFDHNYRFENYRKGRKLECNFHILREVFKNKIETPSKTSEQIAELGNKLEEKEEAQKLVVPW